MKDFFIDLLKYLLRVFGVALIISAIGYFISFKFNHRLSDVYFYIGLICFLLGGASIIGNHDTRNYQADSVSSRDFNKVIKDNLSLRNNFGFLLFAVITGVFMLIFSYMIGSVLGY